MDIFIPIAICVIFIILFSICGWCCKRKREGTVYGYPGANVTVTNQPISQSPVVVPPYPVDARHPTPHSGAPAPGFAPPPSNMPYPSSGLGFYPPPVGAAPYPPTSGPYPPAGMAPYPPAPGAHHHHLPTGYGAPYPPTGPNPPPYDVAVNQPPLNPPAPQHEVYGKQAPYNPHYQ